MNALPLQGRKVVVTRQRHQAQQLATLLEGQGATVFILPTIHVEALEQRPPVDVSKENVDWILFTSPNGVEHGMDLMKKHHANFQGIQFACLGEGTHDVLKNYGFSASWLPPSFNAECVVESWSEPEGTKVLMPCGNLARKAIEDGLKIKGTEVIRWEVYSTQPLTEVDDEARRGLEQEGVDWVLFASSSAVQGFHGMRLALPQARYASIGAMTSQTMRELGYSIDVEAENSDLVVWVQQIVKATVSVV